MKGIETLPGLWTEPPTAVSNGHNLAVLAKPVPKPPYRILNRKESSDVPFYPYPYENGGSLIHAVFQGEMTGSLDYDKDIGYYRDRVKKRTGEVVRFIPYKDFTSHLDEKDPTHASGQIFRRRAEEISGAITRKIKEYIPKKSETVVLAETRFSPSPRQVIVIDRGRNDSELNALATELSGYTLDELVKQAITDSNFTLRDPRQLGNRLNLQQMIDFLQFSKKKDLRQNTYLRLLDFITSVVSYSYFDMNLIRSDGSIDLKNIPSPLHYQSNSSTTRSDLLALSADRKDKEATELIRKIKNGLESESKWPKHLMDFASMKPKTVADLVKVMEFIRTGRVFYTFVELKCQLNEYEKTGNNYRKVEPQKGVIQADIDDVSHTLYSMYQWMTRIYTLAPESSLNGFDPISLHSTMTTADGDPKQMSALWKLRPFLKNGQVIFAHVYFPVVDVRHREPPLYGFKDAEAITATRANVEVDLLNDRDIIEAISRTRGKMPVRQETVSEIMTFSKKLKEADGRFILLKGVRGMNGGELFLSCRTGIPSEDKTLVYFDLFERNIHGDTDLIPLGLKDWTVVYDNGQINAYENFPQSPKPTHRTWIITGSDTEAFTDTGGIVKMPGGGGTATQLVINGGITHESLPYRGILCAASVILLKHLGVENICLESTTHDDKAWSDITETTFDYTGSAQIDLTPQAIFNSQLMVDTLAEYLVNNRSNGRNGHKKSGVSPSRSSKANGHKQKVKAK